MIKGDYEQNLKKGRFSTGAKISYVESLNDFQRKNLATQDIFSLNISYPLQLGWYNAFINLNTYYSHYKADFGQGRTIDLDVYAYNIFSPQRKAGKRMDGGSEWLVFIAIHLAGVHLKAMPCGR